MGIPVPCQPNGNGSLLALGAFLCGRVDLATKTAGFERWDGDGSEG